MSWLPKQTIVVPVDFSKQSKVAVDVALACVAGTSHVYLVHVLPVLSPVEPGVIWDTLTDASRCESAEVSLREWLDEPKYRGCHVKTIVGDPGCEITGHAKALAADMIVMPSHGRTGLKRLLIGSVAERVVRLAHCPVLVLRDGGDSAD